MIKKILFVSHSKDQCGIYQFGKEIYRAVSTSERYEFIRVEVESLHELKAVVSEKKPDAVIYNFHPSVMPWLISRVSTGVFKSFTPEIDVPQIGFIHEITQGIADNATNYRNKIIIRRRKKLVNALFDFYIAADPTLLLKNPIVYKTGRLIKTYHNSIQADHSNGVVIGSFGFATAKKGFESIVKKVQKEFDRATVRINMPFAEFGDKNGINAKKIAAKCKSLIKKEGIKLEITHDFLNDSQLLDFLAANDLNVFLYKDRKGRGISSAADNALAVYQPIAVSDCPMFRHLLAVSPEICADRFSLKQILEKGFEPLKKISEEWNEENMRWELERIMDSVFKSRDQIADVNVSGYKKIKSAIRKNLTLAPQTFTWLRDTSPLSKDYLNTDAGLKYEPVDEKNGVRLNRILDDSARELYKPAEELLIKAVPDIMAKKIARANVQQAFIFDTVYRFLQSNKNAKILCVGSYEDTAAMALIKMGYAIEEIDPMINYYLQEFYTKPSVVKASYDIIFSTSVIEHDPDDKSFLECVEGLLAPGGKAVLTCDYKDGWVPGEPKPEVDARFYTKKDMEQRMLSYMPQCKLVEEGNWDCPEPDFVYLDKYRYTFATFTVEKSL